MRILSITLALVTLAACEESTSSSGQTTTTSARVEARRREVVPPSPPPVMGQKSNSYLPPPTLPEQTETIRESPPPGTSTVETVTPDAAKRDRKITDKLRKAIQEDDALSPEGKRVEVITKDRKVTLKGQVHTERERMAIDSKARAADDVIDVDDQIELVP
jgi:hyperosmotically inducible periplasmic protein